MNKIKDKLLFIYNADSSVFAQVSDAIKKVVAPNKYECNLCMITYGTVSMKDEWKKFLDTLSFEKLFVHRDEFQKQYPKLRNVKLPAVFILQDNVLELLVSAEEINKQKDIAGLKELISGRINGATAP